TGPPGWTRLVRPTAPAFRACAPLATFRPREAVPIQHSKSTARGRSMKLPISWLHDWVETSAEPDQLADALTRRGFYVEGIETHGHAYPGVVVARVLEVERHPKADRLSLCRVDAGAEPLQVVCGAPNVRPGMIAPLATVGATLPGGTTIQKAKIRGI